MLIYGIPSSEINMPYAVPVYVVPSSISIRAEASFDASVVGTAAQGLVLVNGRNADSSYLYSLEYQGWLRADSAYIDLGRTKINDIPIWLE